MTTAPVTDARGIDLNADLGEGFGVWRLGDDDALLGLVTSANVACGFHAGDPATMRRVCARAAAAGVAVGAQVSYRDLAGFGRRFIDVEPAELADDVLYQLAALDGIARAARHPGAPTSSRTAPSTTPRSATRPRRRPSSTPSLASTGGCRCSACPGRRCCGRPRRPACGRSPEGFADRGYTPDGHARAAARAGRAGARPGGGRRARRPHGGRRRRGRGGRHAGARCRSSRSACTATPRARSSSPARCGRRWAAGVGRRAVRREGQGCRGSRSTVRSRPDSRSAATSSIVRPAP